VLMTLFFGCAWVMQPRAEIYNNSNSHRESLL
jgi:hypothetical protein